MAGSDAPSALDHLRAQCWQRWSDPPAAAVSALDAELEPALARAGEAEPETLLVMNPTSRPRRLQLAVVCDDRSLDEMYHQEWCELAVAAAGQLYLIYRRRDGEDYGVAWDQGVTLPASLQPALPEALAVALLDPAA